MKSILLFVFMNCFICIMFAQKTVQVLEPSRLSIFKNGTYFIKKTGAITFSNNAFTIAAPINALFGSYWLSTGLGSTVKSINIKLDTFNVLTNCESLNDYYKAAINKRIAFYRSYGDKETFSGILLSYNPMTQLIKVKTDDNKIMLTKATDFERISIADANSTNQFMQENIKPLATVRVNSNANNSIISTLSLHNGMQWIPSYLFTIINDKEATLSMKATIINGSESFLNTDVDIIIGNPEMFYGKDLDPICINYLKGDLLDIGTSSNTLQNTNFYSAAFNTTSYSVNQDVAQENVEEPQNEEKEGDKLEDLYVYKLGKIDLEENARVIIPITSVKINYEDIYTVHLPYNSASENKDIPIEVDHKYRLSNNTNAPFTTGSILVVNQNELPIAQTELKYTPVNGKQEVKLSKAIDVIVKNEEIETKREKSVRKIANNEYLDKFFYNGTISLQNMQNKKVKVTVNKNIVGSVFDVSNKGKMKNAKDYNTKSNTFFIVDWEVELEPNQKVEINYNYSVFEK